MVTHRGANEGVAIIFCGIEGVVKKKRGRKVYTAAFGFGYDIFIFLETER
jgi:hypothetical protein